MSESILLEGIITSLLEPSALSSLVHSEIAADASTKSDSILLAVEVMAKQLLQASASRPINVDSEVIIDIVTNLLQSARFFNDLANFANYYSGLRKDNSLQDALRSVGKTNLGISSEQGVACNLPPSLISPRIQLARENLGLSEADLARQLNTYSDHISDWECGTTEVPAGMIIPLANALKCDPLWLLTGNSPEVAK